jgi:LytS/YehU family sensor histidine kinase
MEALQAQIEPHFLFNTLASIDQLILTDPPRASRMQQSLIRYLRSSMPQIRDGHRPTLGQQVDLSAAYLESWPCGWKDGCSPSSTFRKASNRRSSRR